MRLGSSRADSLEYPDLEFVYFTCAKEFGWTITETDEQPVYMTSWIMAISQIEIEVENERQSATS